jgi:eukaryotic-like serine/threonine-protein kinase
LPEQVDDPLIGKVLSDRFEIVAPIGVGGMGRVYKAVQRPLDRIVALKVLNPRYDGSKDPGFEKRFFLEASMTAKLKHPNTITVHDYGRTDDGIFYIAMEYVEGETLQQTLSHGRLAWQRALFIGAQIARSLREAHKLGLVHRDLKPANIMLINEGTGGDIVKVLDFGLVKSFMGVLPRTSSGEQASAEKETNRAEITQAGVLLGSPMYMAPEQARNEADQRTDVYALGVLMFQTMAGRPPFVGKESIDVIVKHIREKPPELRTLVPELPFEVNALIMKCLEKEPRARFQSMEELLEAMRVATQGQGISGVFADPRTSSNAQNPRANSSANVVVRDQATPGSTRVAEALESPSVPVEVVLSAEHELPRGRLIAMILGITLLGVAVGGGVAWSLTHPGAKVTVLPTPVVPEVPKPVAPTPVRVTFLVTSQPPGAVVTHQGAVLGPTPVRFTAELGAEPEVRATFTFSLDGYQAATITAHGSSGAVPVDVVLEKVPPTVVTSPATRPVKNPKTPKNPKPENPPGYKDDPYQ